MEVYLFNLYYYQMIFILRTCIRLGVNEDAIHHWLFLAPNDIYFLLPQLIIFGLVLFLIILNIFEHSSATRFVFLGYYSSLIIIFIAFIISCYLLRFSFLNDLIFTMRFWTDKFFAKMDDIYVCSAISEYWRSEWAWSLPENYEYTSYWGPLYADLNLRVTTSSLLFVVFALGFFFLYLVIFKDRILRECSNLRVLTYICFSFLGGLCCLVSKNLIYIYIAFELMAFPIYYLFVSIKTSSSLSSSLTGLRSDKAVAGSIVYFIISAIASCLLLLTGALFYFLFGTVDLVEIAYMFEILSSMSSSFSNYDTILNLKYFIIFQSSIVAIFSFYCLFLSLVFKLGLFPTFNWVPDVYDSAPFNVLAFLLVFPKLFVFYVFLALVSVISSLPENFSYYFFNIVFVIGVLSLFVGTLGALSQYSLKRIIAYGSMSHFGLIFIAVSCYQFEGFISALVYAFFYGLMSLGFFSLLDNCVWSDTKKPVETLSELNGLFKTNKSLAWLFITYMVIFSGLPPFSGFYIKFGVLESLVSGGYLFSAFIVFSLSVVSVFYYIKLIYDILFSTNLRSGIFLPTSSSSRVVLVGITLVHICGIFFVGDLCKIVFVIINTTAWI